MDIFRPPPEMDFASGNVAETWRKWIQKFENYMIASEKNTKPDVSKIAIFLNLLGDEGFEIYNTFKFTKEVEYTKVIEKFTEYCTPRKNVVFERYKFFSCSQQEGQSVDNYTTQLKTLASTCEFEGQEDSLIRDRIVLGLRDNNLQERLLREPDLSLQKAVEFVRAAEISKQQFQHILEPASTTVDALKQQRKGRFQKRPTYNNFQCKRCGTTHQQAECPAYGKTCLKCNKRNHFAALCTSRTEINEVELEDSRGLYVDSVSVKCVNSMENVWLKKVKIEDTEIEFKLDTGAETNVLPLSQYNDMCLATKKLSKTNVTLLSYGNFKLKPEGELVLKCSANNCIDIPLKFIVVDVLSKPILGLKACQMLKLIKRIDEVNLMSKEAVINNNSEIFMGLGKFPGNPYHIELKPEVKPVIDPPRRVPLALNQRLRETLNNLESQGVIEKVNKPTDWVNSLVIVEKPNGSLRICLDPRNLNKAIKREHHIIPTAEELISRLEGKQVFSVLDLKDGFWQVPLDEQSADLCTFNTPFGRYKFLRMPFGIASAPEVFQKRNLNLFDDIENVEVYFDDVIVTGRNEQEHDLTLAKVLDRAKENNVKFNPEKFQFKVPEVKYVGQIISKEGIKADPQHIKAITDMEAPTDKGGVRRFLGMVNYVSKFIPNVSTITSPLRNLLKDKVDFNWFAEHENAFKQIKSLLSSSTVLKVFNSSKEAIIQCDSSKDGLGACLIQEGHPVSYASRSLTETEQNYAQIEKEMLAMVFAVQKYHNFVYGKKFLIQTDHKPLTNIVTKPLCNISTRLQRMLLKLLKYQYDVEYIKGSEMYLADTLSRAYIKDDVTDDPEMLNVIHVITKSLPLSERRVSQFVRETQKDSEMTKAIEYCKKGWPGSRSNMSFDLKQYYKVRENLYVNEGLFFFNNKLVVPKSLRQEMLELIHESHFGMVKCKARAREILYWPGMSKDIELLVGRCEVCEKFSKQNAKEPLLPHEPPNRPFEQVGADIMEFGHKYYLVVVDYYSKWIEVSLVANKTAMEVIGKLKCIFARYGVPKYLICDNNPFNSFKVRKFAKDWDFEHKFSSPRFPQSNGMAERAVGIVKNILRKTNDINVGLMEYRNTPLSDLNLSPAQLMFNRRLKTKLPMTDKLLKTQINKNVKPQLVARQNKQKYYHDRYAHSLPELNSGDNIVMLNFKTGQWEKGKVLYKHKLPRSYIVIDSRGKTLRRNRKHLKKSNNCYEQMNVYDGINVMNNDLSEKEGVNDSNAQHVSNQPPPHTVTKRGRVIKPPSKFKDYYLN